jgi:hypothetical protein
MHSKASFMNMFELAIITYIYQGELDAFQKLHLLSEWKLLSIGF